MSSGDGRTGTPADRWRLFRAVADAVRAESVLYPGSYVDIAPSFVFPSVRYVDTDPRAKAFFADARAVDEIISSHAGAPTAPEWWFIARDYTGDLGLAAESFDLLVSLYAGFVPDHCTGYLRLGGTLLVNASHGDAAVASIDDRYRLSGAVPSRSGEYTVRTTGLDGFLVPKKPLELTRAALRGRGSGRRLHEAGLRIPLRARQLRPHGYLIRTSVPVSSLAPGMSRHWSCPKSIRPFPPRSIKGVGSVCARGGA